MPEGCGRLLPATLTVGLHAHPLEGAWDGLWNGGAENPSVLGAARGQGIAEPAGELAPHGPIRHPENTSRLSPANIYPSRIAV